jgi:hypothetical protein
MSCLESQPENTRTIHGRQENVEMQIAYVGLLIAGEGNLSCRQVAVRHGQTVQPPAETRDPCRFGAPALSSSCAALRL